LNKYLIIGIGTLCSRTLRSIVIMVCFLYPELRSGAASNRFKMEFSLHGRENEKIRERNPFPALVKGKYAF
jgi:hypothetical protein